MRQHDAFVVRPLDDLRACAAAPVLAGFEQCSATLRKLNPGVLLAARRAPFLGLCLASWANYSTAWDDNCCARSYVIHSDHPGLAQARGVLEEHRGESLTHRMRRPAATGLLAPRAPQRRIVLSIIAYR